jgi:hypothetical protein
MPDTGMSYDFIVPQVNAQHAQSIVGNSNNSINESINGTIITVNSDGSIRTTASTRARTRDRVCGKPFVQPGFEPQCVGPEADQGLPAARLADTPVQAQRRSHDQRGHSGRAYAQVAISFRNWRNPSVNGAGPGARMSQDLISCSCP